MNDQQVYEFYAHPANLAITGPGHRRKRPTLSSMTAVRFDPEVIARVKDIASSEGVTVGAWIRRAVEREAAELAPVDVIAPDPSGVLHCVRVPARLLRDAAEAEVERQAYRPRTFACPHMSVGNVASASCGICGPLAAVA